MYQEIGFRLAGATVKQVDTRVDLASRIRYGLGLQAERFGVRQTKPKVNNFGLGAELVAIGVGAESVQNGKARPVEVVKDQDRHAPVGQAFDQLTAGCDA